VKKNFVYIVIALILVMLTSTFANEGSGDVKIGYIFTDEDGNLSVNQESYNLYKGFGFSLNNFNYITDNGLNFNANLNNITLNNRNLYFSASKSGLFKLSVKNNQYRRFYDANGVYFTRRQTTGVQANIIPSKNLKIFGGFNTVNKHGGNYDILRPLADTVYSSTDYNHTSFNIGGQGFCPYGNLRIEYRKFNFNDNLKAVNDRTADIFNISAFSTVPRYRWITLAGGYHYRQDKMDATAVELTTNEAWGAAKIYFPHRITADYRILFARTKHETSLNETDNWVNTFTLSKTWTRYGGLRVGYENRYVDDLYAHTVTNGALFSGWYKYQNRLYLKGKLTYRNKDLKTGTTLTGDEDYTKYLFSATYKEAPWGDLTARVDSRIKKNDDINSEADYTSLSSTLNLHRKGYGRFTVTYSYYLGKYYNYSDKVSYEFADHVVTGTISPVSYKKVTVIFGGTYYRSRRDQDIEKYNLSFTGIYSFPYGHDLEVKYNVFNYDDYLLNNNYYTGNFVEVNLIKHLSL